MENARFRTNSSYLIFQVFTPNKTVGQQEVKAEVAVPGGNASAFFRHCSTRNLKNENDDFLLWFQFF